MKQKIIGGLIILLNHVTGRSFLYVRKKIFIQTGGTAVKDERSVWHVGNVYNKANIAYGIAQNGYVEKAETKILHILLQKMQENKQDITFYDIGANIGYYGIIAAAKYETKTYSFEPLEEYRACLHDSIVLNRTENRHIVFSTALSDHAGKENFTISGSGSSLEKGFNDDASLPTTTVEVDTLDSVVTKEHLSLPDFIKIDVEGHEWAVLKGAKQVIEKAKPVVLLEMCSSLENIGRQYQNPYYEDTIQYFIKQEYQMYLIKDDRTIILWDKNQKITYAGMFVCLHNTHHTSLLKELEQKFIIVT